ncbi:MAG: hypothetical protein ACYC4E_01350 [Carboxydocellales bacterium]
MDEARVQMEKHISDASTEIAAQTLEASIPPEAAPKESIWANLWVVRGIFLALIVLVQMSILGYMEWILAKENSNLANEAHPLRVVDRTLNLSEYLEVPELMSVSPDKSLLALRDSNQLKIYDLITGQLITQKDFSREHLVALRWLPDRNRLIYALISEGSTIEVNLQPKPMNEDPLTNLTEDPHDRESSEDYRSPKTVLLGGYQISLYSLDPVSPSKYEVNPTLNAENKENRIQVLNQVGIAPRSRSLSLYFSTYSNLLYIRWVQNNMDYLAMVDIMKRVKDFRLPSGRLTNLAVVPKTGEVWAEVSTHNGYYLYTYHKGAWKHHKELEGYRLLGAAENGQLALAIDQQDWVSEVDLQEKDGNLHTAWVFQEPVKLENLRFLDTGNLLLMNPVSEKTSIFLPNNKGATVYPIYPTEYLYSFSPDGKMLVNWDVNSRQLKIYQEVQE